GWRLSCCSVTITRWNVPFLAANTGLARVTGSTVGRGDKHHMRQRMRAECGASSARSAERIRQPCAFSGQGHGIARSGFTEEPSAARDRALTGELDVHDAESPGVPVASLEIVQQR